MNREQLIEEAAKAIRGTRLSSAWGELREDEREFRREQARAALVVFEGAYTPTDDERAFLDSFRGWDLDEVRNAPYAAVRAIGRLVHYIELNRNRTVQGEGFDEGTLVKVYDALIAALPEKAEWEIRDAVNTLQNAGILFRERTVQGEPSDARLIENALEWIGHAWDDGNASGLDGWVGPGRGAGEVDREAQRARTRMVHKAEAALRAAAAIEGGEHRG